MVLKWRITTAGNIIFSFEFGMNFDDFDMYVTYISQIFKFEVAWIIKF